MWIYFEEAIMAKINIATDYRIFFSEFSSLENFINLPPLWLQRMVWVYGGGSYCFHLEVLTHKWRIERFKKASLLSSCSDSLQCNPGLSWNAAFGISCLDFGIHTFRFVCRALVAYHTDSKATLNPVASRRLKAEIMSLVQAKQRGSCFWGTVAPAH